MSKFDKRKSTNVVQFGLIYCIISVKITDTYPNIQDDCRFVPNYLFYFLSFMQSLVLCKTVDIMKCIEYQKMDVYIIR